MSLLKISREKRIPDEPETEQRDHEPASTSGWTAGRARVSKLLSGLVLIVMVGGGLLGAAAFAAVLTDTGQVMVDDGVDGLTGDQQEAAAFAGSYVGAWLSATRAEPAAFGELADDETIAQLGETATTFRQLQVSSVAPATDGAIAVIVTAWVQELDMSGGGEDPTTRWVLRAYSLVVTATDGALTAVGLPAPVAVDDLETSPPSNYGVTLTSDDPLFASVTEFLGAYTAGIGDLSRYVTPGSEIAAIAPPIAADVAVQDVLASEAPSQAPSDGEQAHVFVEATLESIDGRVTPVSYLLTLTARADRWEVTSIDPTPITDTES